MGRLLNNLRLRLIEPRSPRLIEMRKPYNDETGTLFEY
jgi:hypothetical protein